MQFQLPQSFWPALYRLARAKDWPPETEEDAAAFLVRVVPEGLLSLLMYEKSLPAALARAARNFAALDQTNRVRTFVFEQTVRTLLDVADGIPIIVLKGTDYAYRLYPAPHLRPRQDIDVLVQREHAAEVAARLKRAGFKQYFPAGDVARVASHHEAVFVVGNGTVEVHHSMIQRSRVSIDYRAVWMRAKPWSGFDSRLSQLDEVDGVIFHTLNMATDEFSTPFFRHLDVWLMLHDRPEILAAAVDRAREWAARRAVYGALRQTGRYFREFRTAAVEDAMDQLLGRRTRAFLDRRVLPDPWSPRKRYGRPGQLWRKLWLMDDWTHRLRFAAYYVYALTAGVLLATRDREPDDGLRKTNRLFSPSWNRRLTTHSKPAAENSGGTARGSNP